jgi:hypothetical protein
MVYGTSYFPTLTDAHKYYGVLGFYPSEVDGKVESGEINIGKPPGYLGHHAQAILRKDQGGSMRWWVSEDVRIG